MDWDAIVANVGTFIREGAPVAEALVPAWAPAIQIGAKLLTAAANAEPTAVALVKTIQSGEDPSAADLQQFATDYEDAYQQLHADIARELAATPT